MEQTVLQQLITEIDKAIDSTKERQQLCVFRDNRIKYDFMIDGLLFSRGAAEKLLEIEKLQMEVIDTKLL
ncbi:hypothetical protein [Flavobacterium psychrotrophum]|uniref:hypothetical protein n=1 Tax=Flavobacterium psychrotrophum TaxID=2294119 RepID=UPI000E31D246|nr:hypothetical protein [Flavobacterium psychrotrophum]